MCVLLAGHTSTCPHNYRRAWVEGSSILPTWSLASAESRDLRPSAHPSRGQATRCQDSRDPVLFAPTSLCSLYEWEHVPRPGSLRPRVA